MKKIYKVVGVIAVVVFMAAGSELFSGAGADKHVRAVKEAF